MGNKLLWSSPDWSETTLMKTWETIDRIAKEKYGLTYYTPQIEVVTANQMIHYHSMNGMPYMYPHWSFGKHYVETHKQYVAGRTGLAYETIINSDPAVCYIMENNSMTMQALVLCHAAVGHSSFFKNSSVFQTWTTAGSILAYAKFAQRFVAECEEKYGVEEVEKILDAAHSLRYVGIDKYERTRTKRKEELEKLAEERRKYEEEIYNETWDKTVTKKAKNTKEGASFGFPWPFPEENLLYFIEKNSPSLEEWQRELVHIVRHFAQYFYPQIQTKLMNEGWASFWHYTLMNDLYDGGYISEGNMLEFLESHSAVCCIRESPSPGFSPYALGFRMFKKIRQVCEAPEERDYAEFPTIVNTNWIETLKDICENYNDSSFVGQFLSSDIIEEFGMLAVTKNQTYDPAWNETQHELRVDEIQDKDRLSSIRKHLSNSYAYSTYLPSIEVLGYDHKGDRTLILRHNPLYGQSLEEESKKECMKYIKVLWGKYPISLETIDKDGKIYRSDRKY